MTVRIGKIELPGVQDLYTEEARNLVEQRVPEQKGSIFQDLGREPVTLVLEGLLFGDEVLSALEQLRSAQEKAEPLPFAADIAVGSEITEVIIEEVKIRQVAGYKGRYRFTIRIREHVEPPESPARSQAPVNDAVAADADTWAGDSLAASGALQDPATLADTLAANPGALAHMSADELAGAVADKADLLSGDQIGEIMTSVGELDPDKLDGMMGSLNKAGKLGTFMEKLAAAKTAILEKLKKLPFKKLLAAITGGVEFIKRAKEVGAAAKAVIDEIGGFDPLASLRPLLDERKEKE